MLAPQRGFDPTARSATIIVPYSPAQHLIRRQPVSTTSLSTNHDPVVLFLKTRHPIDPVALVHHVCRDLANNTGKRSTRFAKRLSPMSMMGKATEAGLETVARAVLAPKFHGEGNKGKKVCDAACPTS